MAAVAGGGVKSVPPAVSLLIAYMTRCFARETQNNYVCGRRGESYAGGENTGAGFAMLSSVCGVGVCRQTRYL